MLPILLKVQGPRGVDSDLIEALQRNPALRGQVKRGGDAQVHGAMGDLTQITVCLASAGLLPALTRALETWLSGRRQKITVTLTAPDGATTVHIGTEGVKPGDIERLFQATAQFSQQLPSSSEHKPQAS